MATLTDAQAVAACATGAIITEGALSATLDAGTPSPRIYGLTADHSAILPIRTRADLDARPWAGFWQGATSVPIRHA